MHKKMNDPMVNEIAIPIHRVIDKEAVLARMRQACAKGFDYKKADELGVVSRIANLLCAMHALTMEALDIFDEADMWLEACRMDRREIKRALSDFRKAYDKWFAFWRSYQSVEGVREMNRELDDLREQFMRWVGMPVHWEPGQRQDIPKETEPLIEIDRGERIWRIYRDVAKSEIVGDVEEDWAVMRSGGEGGDVVMTLVERGMDKSSAQMSARRMSANDPGRLYTASRLETITERRLEVVPMKAYCEGEMIGDVKSVIKK